ncbi:MAG: hypothetical protein LBI45_02135 [Bacteroidales bacterium]|jgi:hypothetical protein|nr:hypothetical protein [Bacteroidales bacterium]
MSTNSRKIGQALRHFSNNNGKGDNRNLFFTAEVKKVDDERCDVEIAETTFTGVHLAAVSDGNENSLIIKPKVGSVVLICDKTGGDMAWMNVVAFSEIASITMKIDKIVINEGKNDGMIIIQKLTDKLNGLKDTLNSLISDYNAHIHTTTATVGLGPALGVISPIAKKTNPALTFNKSDYENEKIKH